MAQIKQVQQQVDALFLGLLTDNLWQFDARGKVNHLGDGEARMESGVLINKTTSTSDFRWRTRHPIDANGRTSLELQGSAATQS